MVRASMFGESRQIGQAIRSLRKQKNITGEELGKLASLSQSKISKIETGFYSHLQFDEIQRILNILEAPSIIRQQVLRALGKDEVNGMHSHAPQHISLMSATELERTSRHIRIYTSDALPALLQTVSYRQGSLRYKGVEENMMGEHIKNLLMRQDRLYDTKHHFDLIIPQSALYTLATSKKDHVAQLDRLERIVHMTGLGVRLGIIPLEAGTVLIEHSSFALYDDTTLVQALAGGEITTKNKQDIELHARVFDALARLAYYDDDALQLIRQAMDYFS